MPYIYGQLISADLENLATAPSSPSRGRVYFDTALIAPRFYDGTSWFSLSGGNNLITKTTNYVLLVSDDTVVVTPTAANCNITLPTAVGYLGKRFTITQATDWTIQLYYTNILTTSAQTISGWASGDIFLLAKNESITVQSDGTNWVIINRYQPNTLLTCGTTKLPIIFSHTTNVTISNQKWCKYGDKIRLTGTITYAGATDAVVLTGTLPLTPNPAQTGTIRGTFRYVDASALTYQGVIEQGATTAINFMINRINAASVTYLDRVAFGNGVPVAIAASDTILYDLEFPTGYP